MRNKPGSDAIDSICRLAPVIPVLVIQDLAHARPLAEALVAGGLPVLEVTLRTTHALPAIREMSQVPGSVVGAGTLLSPDDVLAAENAGAAFGVSPGVTDPLLRYLDGIELPFLPGAATVSECMQLLDRGYTVQKFFPAEASGGAPAIKSIGGPIPQIRFCPTGGIDLKKAKAYLSSPNVLCVGGSWVAPDDLVRAGDWDAISELARQAAALPRAT